MYTINESPVGDLLLHCIHFPVRPISSSEMASEQKSLREGFGGSCVLRPLVDIFLNAQLRSWGRYEKLPAGKIPRSWQDMKYAHFLLVPQI